MSAPSRKLLIAAVVLLGWSTIACGKTSDQRPQNSEWGPIVEGLRASLMLIGRHIEIGQPIRFRFRIQNVSSKPINIVNAGFWSNHRVDVETVGGAAVPRTEAGMQALKAFLSGSQRKAVLRTLGPGKTMSEEHSIAHFQLQTGRDYRMKVTYAEGSLVVPSNEITFVVQ